MSDAYRREDVDFFSEGTRCSAWLYLPQDCPKCPVIVMAHGLGGTREMRLPEYAKAFAAAGYACLLFDYRNYGASDGDKRQLVNVKMQHKDWENAIEYIKKDERIDPERLIIFGSSFSGGHAIFLSSHRNDVKAAIAQCPYTDTMATIKAMPPFYVLKKSPYILADLLTCITGYHPVMLKLTSYTGENAMMQTDEETTKRFIGDLEYNNDAPARTLLEFLKYSPGRYLNNLKTPIYIAACSKDHLAPADKTLQLAQKACQATCKRYDCGHFEIYLSPYIDEAIKDYLTFLDSIFKAL